MKELVSVPVKVELGVKSSQLPTCVHVFPAASTPSVDAKYSVDDRKPPVESLAGHGMLPASMFASTRTPLVVVIDTSPAVASAGPAPRIAQLVTAPRSVTAP